MTAAVSPSPATQAVLAVSGVSLLAVVVYLCVLVARAMSGLLSRTPNKPRAPYKTTATTQAPESAAAPAKAAGTRQLDLKALIKQSRDAKKSSATKEDMAAHHALFINTLKGHADTVNAVAWSPDGKLLATACDDMQLRLFDIHDLTHPNPKFKWVKTLQIPLGVGFGNDNNSLIAAFRGIPDVCHLALYLPHKRGKEITWEPQWQKDAVLGREQLLDMVVVSSNQAQAINSSSNSSNGITSGGVAVLLSHKKGGKVYGLAEGSALAEFQPNSFENHQLAVSANGRFICVASFTADVMVWEVQFGREGYKGTPRVMDLKGHTSQVLSAAFSPDGSKAVTASKDGTLRVWNTAVRYHLQEDPKTVLKVQLSQHQLSQGQVYERMAWGPDGTIAAVLGQHIHFIDSSSGQVLEVLHAHDGPITSMVWSPQLVHMGSAAEPVAVLASSSTDRRVRLWKSPKQRQ